MRQHLATKRAAPVSERRKRSPSRSVGRLFSLAFVLPLATVFLAEEGLSQGAPIEILQGRVTDVRAERLRLSFGKAIRAGAGDEGWIRSRQGRVEFRVVSGGASVDVTARVLRRSEAGRVRPGDPAFLYPNPGRIASEAEESLSRLDRLIESGPLEPLEGFDLAPDFLAQATGETLDDYEAWLGQLESEPLDLPLFGEPSDDLEDLDDASPPVYPDIETRNTIRTGVDYDRFVFNATGEESSGKQAREQIGRYFRWNYEESGELWKDLSVRAENEFEANDVFIIDEFDLYKSYDLPGGGRFWWENRAIWKIFQNDQGDSYFLDDFEARSVRKINENWEWQRGLILRHKREYDTDSDDGYTRATALMEWNYRNGFESWFDLSYEFTREIRNESRSEGQEYWEHLLTAQYYRFEEKSSFDFYGELSFRDYNQEDDLEDTLSGLFTVTSRRVLSEEKTLGWRLTLEPRYFSTTEDTNTTAVRLQVAPFLEYTKGTSLFVTVEPRIGQVFHHGRVDDSLFLTSGFPREKSDGDYREAGLSLSVSWFPSEKWRFSLYQDASHRWFPRGETGETAFYLFDFPKLADSTTLFGSATLDYICSENSEISLSLSHSRQIYSAEFDESDTHGMNVGLEWLYRF